MFYKKLNKLTPFFYLKKIINVNVNVVCYDLKDIIIPCVRYISQNDYNIFPALHIPMKYNYIIMDENNRI